MPGLPALSRRFPWRKERPVQPLSEAQLLATLEALKTELADAEQRIDAGFEMGKLPERLLRTRAWDRSKRQLLSTARLAALCLDLESAYTEVKRILALRPGRMMKAYRMEPGDGVERALTAVRRALDALEAVLVSDSPRNGDG